MYAVIESGGKQYRVELGSEIQVDRLDVQPGDSITLDRVLLVADGDTAAIGQPVVDGAVVSADVLGQDRGDKIVVFKYKPKARTRVKKGFRAELTTLRISDIAIGDKSAAKDAEGAQAERAKAEKAAAERAAADKAAADKELAAKLAAGSAPDTAEAKPKATRKRSTAKAKPKPADSPETAQAADAEPAAGPEVAKADTAPPEVDAAAEVDTDTQTDADAPATTQKDE